MQTRSNRALGCSAWLGRGLFASLVLIEASVLWIRAVVSPTRCPNPVRQILSAFLVAGLTQVLPCAPHGVHDEYHCLTFATSLAELAHKSRWVKWPNDPSSATRPKGRGDCNRDAPAGLDAMKGCKAWADRAHAVYEKFEPNPS
jgi:hypothetical protein